MALTGADRYEAASATRPTCWIPDLEVPVQRYDPITYDRHVRHSGDDFVGPVLDLLPTGPAWPSWDPDSVFMHWVEGTAQIWGDVDSRSSDLLERESDPSQTLELLPDWERAWGLPDDCVAEPLTIAARQRALVFRITLLGGQSRQFFFNIADYFGLKIEIGEHSPYMCGISRVGDTTNLTGSSFPRWEIGAETQRFYWTVGVGKPRLQWFRCGWGGGEVGVDHHLEIGLTTDAQCLMERLKPAHVELAWRLNLEVLDPMEGTP